MGFLDDDGDLAIYSTMAPSTFTMIDKASYVFTGITGLSKMMEIVESGEDPSIVETYGITSFSLDK